MGKRGYREVSEVSTDLIDLPKRELRTVCTREKLEELTDSVKDLGVLQPILVEKVKSRYRIVIGTRRFMAAQMAGLSTVPCIVTDLTKKKQSVAMIHENFMREDVNYTDLARYLNTLMGDEGLNLAEVSRLIGYSPAWTKMILKLTDYPEDMQDAVEAGHIDPTSAQELMRVKDEVRRRSLLGSAVKGGATQAMIKGWVHSELASVGELPSAPPVSGALDKVEEHPPLTFTCACCTSEHPTENMILVRTCSECYSALRKAFKLMREEGKG